MKIVMVFGAFDFLHQGHRNFLKQAKKLGDRLIVVVARDNTIERIKGKLPLFSEYRRAQAVRRSKLADRVLLGDKRDPYRVIRKIRPNVIGLGYDQNSFVKNLRQTFPNIMIIRLKPYKQRTFKSSKLKRKSYA